MEVLKAHTQKYLSTSFSQALSTDDPRKMVLFQAAERALTRKRTSEDKVSIKHTGMWHPAIQG